MSEVFFEIGIVFVLILINGLFAMSEIAIVSVRRARLEQLRDDGSKRAEATLALVNDPNRFLSTVQIGITLVGIFAGAYGGATLAQRVAPLLTPWLSETAARGVSLVIVVSLITYLSVVVGELVPKRLALQYAESISLLVTWPMSMLSKVATPFVWLLSFSTDVLVRLLGVQEPPDTAVSEEEIRIMLRQSSQAGIIEETEREMVEGIFRLGDWPVKTIMTPRHQIKWLDINATQEEIQHQLYDSPHARLPVCDGDLDNVLGVVHAKNLLSNRLENNEFNLDEIMTNPIFAPETVNVPVVLEKMRKTGVHLTLIIDEYGQIEGLVTPFDILETIVGDIPTSSELEMPRIIERDEQSWFVDGLLVVYDFQQNFELTEDLPGADTYQTMGGFMIYMLGRLPQEGDSFIWHDMKFEVADMDGKRVDKIIVTMPPPPETASSEET